MRLPIPCALLLVALSSGLSGADLPWPQFRGPNADGRAGGAQLALQWSKEKGVRWETPIHGKAWSSPAIGEGRVWVTTASEDGTTLGVVAVDLETGKVLLDKTLFHVENPQFAHKFNSYGSPSPVLEAGRVYVTFGSPGTACLDAASGEVVWTRRDFVCNHFRGAGSSPVIFENLLILPFDGSDHQFIAAMDKRTGATAWRTERSIDFKDLLPNGKPEAEGDWRKAYSTPILIQESGEPTLVSLGSKALYAYDPRTGVERWRLEERKCHSGSAQPAFGHGLIFSAMGFSKGELIAFRPGGKGVVEDSQIAWRSSRNVPTKPSPLVVGEWLFMIDDGGIASCLEAATGREIWRERVGGNFSASPLLASGRIYFFNEEGKTTVIEAAPEYKVLAVNDLGNGFMATPAIADNALILRSREALHRIDP